MFGTFFVNSETAQEEQCWGILRDTYTYIYDLDYYNYEKENPLTKTNKEITIWDVESENNTISFRTDLWVVFLSMVYCESEECYDEYRDAWDYNSTTDSFSVTYRYDNETQELEFVDPLHIESVSIGPDMDVPLDPKDLGEYLFLWWGGLGFTFLPVFHPDFSFKTDFQLYELAYPDFEISFQDTFKFQRKKFEGYSYEFSFTFEEEVHSELYFKEEIETKFSYNKQGVLYNYYNHVKYFEKTTDKFELKRKSTLDYSIDSIDENLTVANSWVYGLSGILVSTIVIFGRRRKK
ncbi:MAG: hypothetical protein H7641_01160 [Candidatus Heimdallarchaeota archaeon]|nr:hypothetical protein [Candidatus Heimdallarchaeota archaeon]MCK4876176.1 hypothetical protein [Candidatus Heimdallarchaeota archaeon]